jgi:hypothetical protein
MKGGDMMQNVKRWIKENDYMILFYEVTGIVTAITAVNWFM